MNEQSYPVVTKRVLDAVPAKRFFSRVPNGRGADEIPRPLPGHRLVYFTRGEYVLDTTSLPRDSPTVVDASQVAVVDVTSDTEVVVLLTIPSQDAGSFTVRVTFLCTVDDPVAVVRTGGADAESLLSGYLKAHTRLFELGLDYALADINEMRRKVNAQIRAYVTVVPPAFDGMTAELASVEVLTPEEQAKLQESLRDERAKFTTESERRLYEQRLEDQQLRFKHLREADAERHSRELAEERHEFQRRQAKHTVEALADDPMAALSLSYTAGDTSAKELAAEVKEARHQQMAADREDLRDRIQYQRERDKARWEAERLDGTQRAQWHREDQQARSQAELQRAQWDREDARAQIEYDRERDKWAEERDRREFEAKVEVIRELATHGHLDSLNLRLDHVVNDVLGGKATSQVEKAADRPALESLDDEPQPDDLDGDEKVRVDD
jgi:hypothetical protein